MTLSFGLVARGTTVLAEYSAGSSSSKRISRAILQKIPNEPTKKSYSFEGLHYHYIVDEDGLTFMVVATEDVVLRVAFSYLNDIRSQFQEQCGTQWRTAIGDCALNDVFARSIARSLEYWNNPNSEKLTQARNQIENVKGEMISTIGKVLDRGDKLPELLDRTDMLQTQGDAFKAKSTKLRRQMCLQDLKMKIICGLITLLVVTGVVLLIVYLAGGFK